MGDFFKMNFLFLIGIVLGYLFLNFDKMLVGKKEMEKSWADANIQIENRFDLILDLKNILQNIDIKEKNHLEDVMRARNNYLRAETVSEIVKANRQLNSALKALFSALENYPDLSESISIREFKNQLSRIELRLINAFKNYNMCVKKYNYYIQMNPNRFYVRFFGFYKIKYLESDMLEFTLKKQDRIEN